MLDVWINMGVKYSEIEPKNKINLRQLGYNLLSEILTKYIEYIQENKELVQNILGIFKRAIRDKSEILRIKGVNSLFDILE